MNFKIKAVALAFLFSLISAKSFARGGNVCDSVDQDGGSTVTVMGLGPEVPFPWTVKAPFPWGTIEGIWEATLDDGTQVVFSFEIQTDVGNRKILRVLELDQNSNTVIAEGTGVASAAKKLVSAAMSGQGGAYMLFIGAYRDPKKPQLDPVTVLTMRSFNSLETPDLQVVACKVSTTPYDQ